MENDAGTYFIEIYCSGPRDGASHERFVIIVYGRILRETFAGGRSWVPVRQWTDAAGNLRRAREHDTHAVKGRAPNEYLVDAGLPDLHYQYRFRCRRCGLDEQRNYGPDLDALFDRLAEGNRREIPVREFVALAWG